MNLQKNLIYAIINKKRVKQRSLLLYPNLMLVCMPIRHVNNHKKKNLHFKADLVKKKIKYSTL